MDVFLDLDPIEKENISNKDLANLYLKKFSPILDSIGERIRDIKKIGVSYDTASVALYDQAKDLYFLGYFVSAIMVCRSIAEYLAYEIFFEEVEISGEEILLKSVAENLDFRKIVNEFLYNPKKGFIIIDKDSHDLFNEIYTLGNAWIHPNSLGKVVKIKDESKMILGKVQLLISSLRDVIKDYDVSDGKLIKKTTARKKIRPIALKSSDLL